MPALDSFFEETRENDSVRLRELHTLSPALAQLHRALALVNHAWLLEETPIAHFDEDAVALHHLIEAPKRRFERLVFFDYYASHPITFFYLNFLSVCRAKLYGIESLCQRWRNSFLPMEIPRDEAKGRCRRTLCVARVRCTRPKSPASECGEPGFWSLTNLPSSGGHCRGCGDHGYSRLSRLNSRSRRCCVARVGALR
jgi:hypothetical protein